jgi:hypothetical protein
MVNFENMEEQAAQAIKAESEASMAPPVLMEERRPTTLHLKVPLTDQQKVDFSGEISQAVEEIGEGENELKFVSTEIKGRIQASQAKLKELANKIRAGYEIKPVDCEQVLDYHNGTMTVIRLDTLEKVSERPLTVAERQPPLPLKENADDKDASDGPGEPV